MYNRKIYKTIGIVVLGLLAACKIPAVVQRNENKTVPSNYAIDKIDTLSSAKMNWRNFFTDKNLVALIDTALKNNQELNITLQDIEIARSNIKATQQNLYPTITAKAGAGVEKVGRYTSQGAGDASTELEPGKAVPDPLPDFVAGLYANWEIDIWHKLHNAKKAAVVRYLSTVEGKNFVVTNLVAEVANSYYELLALDNQLDIVRKNIALQNNALEVVKLQKLAARTTELAVRKFEAEVLNSKSMEFDILQKITEAENKINFLLARYPQPITRTTTNFNDLVPAVIRTGIPSQLLANRPDIRQAELDLTASKLDVKIAKAEFYPSLGVSGSVGLNALSTSYLLKTPESLLYSVAGEIAGPLINRNAIKAAYLIANAQQKQAIYNYEQTVLNAYIEVINQLSSIGNLAKSYGLKSQQVDALNQSIDLSNDLFRSARADYLEVLMTQRDALDAKLDLIETKKQQMNAIVNIYQALGGGWN